MFKRIITAVIGLPAVIFLVYYGGWPLLLMCLAVALVGLRELYHAFSKTDKPIHLVGYIATVAYFVAAQHFGVGYWLLIALMLFIITAQTCMVVFFKKLTLKDITVSIYGFLYVPFLLSFIILVREHPLGQYYVWLIFTSAFGCDTFAYLAGTTFGKRKLVNTPSPKKSVEGLIGGIIGASLVGWLYGFFVSRFASADSYAMTNIMINAAVISFFGAIFCIIGDMAASAVKRHANIKDFGRVFPGHGGVLDRVDGIIFVAPIVYLVMNVLFSITGYQ